jgi:hypothetical protein
MSDDPKMVGLLKFLAALVADWKQDTDVLIATINHPGARAAVPWHNPPVSTVPDPPPPPQLPASPADYAWCAAYFQTIAYNNYATALGVLRVSPDPDGRDLASTLGYDDVNSVDAATEWMKLISGLFKMMIEFYPIGAYHPAPVPKPPQPSPGDNEAEFWSMLKALLQPQAQRIADFVNGHFSGKAMAMPAPGNVAEPSRSQCVMSIEESAHQLFMDYCRIANHLPDHFSRRSFRLHTRVMTK